MKNNYTVLKLHLELNTSYINDEQRQVLKEYGYMNNSISRDILVPFNITLHALNYAIQRCFGWQNSHLHCFTFCDEEFNRLTEGNYITWAKMAGIYFRAPSEDFDDLYWDDDYKENEYFKTWMRRKYTGPYKYKGFGEYYMNAQLKVKEFFLDYDEIPLRQFNYKTGKMTTLDTIKLKDATIEEVNNAILGMSNKELLERLALTDVMKVPGEDKVSYEKIRDYVNEKTADYYLNAESEKMKKEKITSDRKNREFLRKSNIYPVPFSEKLNYKYDYGDGWEVSITCKDAYYKDQNSNWINTEGQIVSDLSGKIEKVCEYYRPVCTDKDGIEVLDDVGGVGGFCEMLKTLYEYDPHDAEEVQEKEEMQSWASMMGWTGKLILPEKTL